MNTLPFNWASWFVRIVKRFVSSAFVFIFFISVLHQIYTTESGLWKCYNFLHNQVIWWVLPFIFPFSVVYLFRVPIFFFIQFFYTFFSIRLNHLQSIYLFVTLNIYAKFVYYYIRNASIDLNINSLFSFSIKQFRLLMDLCWAPLPMHTQRRRFKTHG